MVTLDDKPRTNKPRATNQEQQTSYNKRDIRQLNAASATHARNANAKAHLSGEIIPGSPPILNIRAAATKMKYDVRIVKAEKSGHLSVFFKAEMKVAGLVLRERPEKARWTIDA